MSPLEFHPYVPNDIFTTMDGANLLSDIETFFCMNGFCDDTEKYKQLQEVILKSSEEIQTAWKKVGLELPEETLDLKFWIVDLTLEQARVVHQTLTELMGPEMEVIHSLK